MVPLHIFGFRIGSKPSLEWLTILISIPPSNFFLLRLFDLPNASSFIYFTIFIIANGAILSYQYYKETEKVLKSLDPVIVYPVFFVCEAQEKLTNLCCLIEG